MRHLTVRLLAASFTILLASAPGAAQPGVPQPQPQILTPEQALAVDAAEYARQYGLAQEEALSRLRAQEESVAATDALAQEFRDRFAGVSIEHRPEYRIVALLTGDDPVPDRELVAGGRAVPIVFRTGAAATREQVVTAMRQHRRTIRAAVPGAVGMGADPRSGALTLMMRRSQADLLGLEPLVRELAARIGVPVAVRLVDREPENAGIAGGARVAGPDPATGVRQICTTGFIVTDGARNGMATAAHCPDELTYLAPDGARVPLEWVNGWGARHQDVQIHVGGDMSMPLFHGDSGRHTLRILSGRRTRESTRVGDFLCRRGESSGYSCALVELVDYAPPGDLCAGPCDPSWVAVAGPTCRPGDSGGPIFLGGTAFGIVKGSSASRGGGCNFYFYMSTDYLPEGWGLLFGEPA